MKYLSILFIALFSFNNLSAQRYTTKYITDANKVGLQWWNDVNTGKYSTSYQYLSSELKKRFSEESWLNQISILMDEFGKIEERSVSDTYFNSEIDGYESGVYVIVEYNVKYSKTKNHTENILLKQNDQLEWKIFDFNYEFQNLDSTKE